MNFKAYDSYEEMMDDMRKAEEKANERVLPFQQGFSQEKDYTHSMRVHVEGGDFIFIFSSYPPYEWLKANEVRLGASQDEADYNDERLRESRERGYMYGRHYSPWCPEGEWGSVHISTIFPISAETFAYAKRNGWTL